MARVGEMLDRRERMGGAKVVDAWREGEDGAVCRCHKRNWRRSSPYFEGREKMGGALVPVLERREMIGGAAVLGHGWRKSPLPWALIIDIRFFFSFTDCWTVWTWPVFCSDGFIYWAGPVYSRGPVQLGWTSWSNPGLTT